MANKHLNGQFTLEQNVEYELRDKDGNIKQLFTDNEFGVALLKTFRKFVKEPIASDGTVKPGMLNSLAAYGLRINGLTGSWGDSRLIKNLITSAGKAGIASRINGSGAAAAFTSIGMGTGTTAANIADTALETGKLADGTADSGVHVLATASVTASRVTTTVTNDTAQLVGTVSITATIAITESGVFNADTNGTLLCRQVFSAINVVSGDSLQITWKVKAA
jgi:hypothetical protein